jgi:hypothetical protein
MGGQSGDDLKQRFAPLGCVAPLVLHRLSASNPNVHDAPMAVGVKERQCLQCGVALAPAEPLIRRSFGQSADGSEKWNVDRLSLLHGRSVSPLSRRVAGRKSVTPVSLRRFHPVGPGCRPEGGNGQDGRQAECQFLAEAGRKQIGCFRAANRLKRALPWSGAPAAPAPQLASTT